MAIPLHNLAAPDPRRQVVAYLGLTRDLTYIDQEVSATASRRRVPSSSVPARSCSAVAS